MQVSIESTGTLKREMKVTVPEERIESEVQNRLKSLSKTTRIHGFRQGKVPYRVIVSRFGKQVRQEVLGEVVQTSFYEALQREKLTPAGRPSIAPLDAGQGEGLSYTASFEIMPEVKLEDVDKMELEKPVFDIGDEDYGRMVEMLRKQRQTLQPVEREAREGDTVEIDFEGKVDGESFEGGSAKDFRLELGQNRLIAGFEEGLAGKKAGDEVTLDLAFPEDYQEERLAGKPVRFEVKLKQVMEPVLPELNDEFFRNFGIQEGGEEAFKREVMEQMRREAENAARNRLRGAVMEGLYEANPIELPESLVHEEIHRLEHQFKDRLRQYGIDPAAEGAPATDHAMFEKQAQKRVALQLIVMELIRKQELKPDPAKVREIIEKNAANYEDSAAVINWYYNEKQRLAEVEGAVLEDAVVDWVAAHARLKEVNVTFDELVNKGQTG